MTNYYRNLMLESHPHVYEPAEDSFLLAHNLGLLDGESFLDVGTGSGIIALMAASSGASQVLGVDVNPAAVELARKNTSENNIKNIEFRISDLFENVSEKFDVIAFNPPYLPVSEGGELARAWSGGEKGVEVIERFLGEVSSHLSEGGRFLILLSSLNDPGELAQKHSLSKVAETKIPFEKLFVYQAEY